MHGIKAFAAGGATAEPSQSDPWAWNAWQQNVNKDPLFSWNMQAPATASSLSALKPYLQQQGKWTPQLEAAMAAYQPIQYATESDAGKTGPDIPAQNDVLLSELGLDGYQTGRARSSGYNELQAILGPDGNPVAGNVGRLGSSALHRDEYAMIASVLGAGLAGPLAGYYGAAGMSPAVAGAASGATIGAGTGAIAGGTQGALKGAVLGGVGGYVGGSMGGGTNPDGGYSGDVPTDGGGGTMYGEEYGVPIDGTPNTSIDPYQAAADQALSSSGNYYAGAPGSAAGIDSMNASALSDMAPQYNMSTDPNSDPKDIRLGTPPSDPSISNAPQLQGINNMDPSTPVPTANPISDWANANPKLAAQLLGMGVGGLQKLFGGGGSGGPGGTGAPGSGAQANLVASSPTLFNTNRQYNAPPAGYRPGFDPEWKYFSGIGGINNPAQPIKTTMPVQADAPKG